MQIERYRAAPHLGPKLLFFSGGSALKGLSQTLIGYTHNSMHIITPFDSGGSSAELRKAFKMPAVGDIRNRLMALADQSITGNPAIYSLFSYRLPKEAQNDLLLLELSQMARGKHDLVAQIPDPMRKIIKHHLESFLQNMPREFDLNGASIGNLILAAGYLEHNHHLDPVIYIYSKLVEVRGVVRPVVSNDLHLVARLENGELICGQHLLTGKECRHIDSKVEDFYLSQNLTDPVRVEIRDKVQSLIEQAELNPLIPMGKFLLQSYRQPAPPGGGHQDFPKQLPQGLCPQHLPGPGMLQLKLERTGPVSAQLPAKRRFF
ncbi:MAG: GAK system CofD-like protein [Desulfurivibrio sp.]|nr:GAK system CofD-like protein [Desulfurivibrio sp.]